MADISKITTLDGTEYNIKDATARSLISNLPTNNLQNLVDGNRDGSVRGIYTKTEDSNYVMGFYAFAEGYQTKASGLDAHAEGSNTEALGTDSHAEGLHTIANSLGQHVFGLYNIADPRATINTKGTYVEIVGNGENENTRSNARTLDWDGNEVLAGTLTTSSIISTPGSGVNYIDGVGGTHAGIYVKKNELNTNSFIPGITIQTKSGGGWAIGNYDNENLQFVYGSKENIDAEQNTYKLFWIDTDGNYTGKAANVTGTVAVANGGTGVTTATKNQVFAAPNGSNGAPSFRALVAADIPTLATSKISGLDTALDGKVAIAGDTMTGNLTISKASESILYLRNTAAALGTAPGSDAYTGQLGFRTSTNVTIGWVDNHYSKDKESITRIAARNNGTGSNVDNSLSLGVANDGTRLVSMTAPSVWRTALGLGAAATRGVDTTPTSGATDLITSGGVYTALDGKVSTGGDTMTGNLTMKGASVPIRQATAKVGTTPSSTLYTGMFAAQDSNGTNIGYVRGFFGTDGATGMQFECVRAVSGSNKYHNLSLRMKADGTRQVTVTEKEPWLSGLGLAPTDITSSVTKVTTMPNGISKINTLTVWRSGYLIQVYISVLPTASPPTAWVTVASGLPAPALAPIVNGRYWENSTAQPALFQVNGSGQLQVAWGAGSKNQVATLVYIAKEL